MLIKNFVAFWLKRFWDLLFWLKRFWDLLFWLKRFWDLLFWLLCLRILVGVIRNIFYTIVVKYILYNSG
jgi:hypothetical protein